MISELTRLLKALVELGSRHSEQTSRASSSTARLELLQYSLEDPEEACGRNHSREPAPSGQNATVSGQLGLEATLSQNQQPATVGIRRLFFLDKPQRAIKPSSLRSKGTITAIALNHLQPLALQRIEVIAWILDRHGREVSIRAETAFGRSREGRKAHFQACRLPSNAAVQSAVR